MNPSSFLHSFLSERGHVGSRLKRDAKGVVLDPAEKARIREELVAFMAQNPLAEGASVSKASAAGFFSVAAIRPMPAVAVIVLITVLGTGGSAAYAAQGALPDEALYGIKININERLEAVLAFDNETRAQVTARHAERRVEEAALLAARQRLTQEVEARIAAQFDRHIAHLTQLENELAEAGHIDAAANIQVRIEGIAAVHGQVLARFEEGEVLTGRQVGVLRERLLYNAQTAKRMREASEERLAQRDEEQLSQRQAAALRIHTHATQELSEAIGYYERFESQLSARAQANAQEEIGLAQELIVEGNAYLRAEEFGEAISSFARSLGHSARVFSIIRSDIALNSYFPNDRDDEGAAGGSDTPQILTPDATGSTESEVEVGAGQEVPTGGGLFRLPERLLR